MTETELQAAIIELAHGLGWLSYHTYNSRRSPSGFPDLVLVRGDRVVFRELKTETGKVSPEQQVWLDSLVAAGADAGVWRPVDLARGDVARDLMRGERDRSFVAGLNVRLAQARAQRVGLPKMRARGHNLARTIDPSE